MIEITRPYDFIEKKEVIKEKKLSLEAALEAKKPVAKEDVSIEVSKVFRDKPVEAKAEELTETKLPLKEVQSKLNVEPLELPVISTTLPLLSNPTLVDHQSTTARASTTITSKKSLVIEDSEEEDSNWRPPQGQTGKFKSLKFKSYTKCILLIGDGRTSLNDRFGY